MLKIISNTLVVLASLAVASSVTAATVSGVDVLIKKDGKTVSRARTDADGKFATGTLEPGPYNVEFRAPKSPSLHGQTVKIAVSTGKGAPTTSDSDGKYMHSGVAMNVEVRKAAKVTGQLTSGAGVAAQKTGPVPAGYEAVKANVKVINGKRHVWVPGPIGSNIGGKWVEEGTEGAVLSTSNKKGGDGEVLQKIVDQAGNVGRR